jgi:alpha-tubulin suppressor-like RCC1 family protein
MPPRSLSAVALLFASLTLVSCRDSQAPETSQTPSPDAPALATAASLSFIQVSGGTDHTCGITSANRAVCWGTGLLGNGGATANQPPVEVAGGHSFRQVSAGGEHTCAVTTDFRAYCWGRNVSGQLGDGSTTRRETPVPVAGGRQFRAISVGREHTCAVGFSDGRAYCWGSNNFGGGQLGDGTTTDRLTPTPVAGGFIFRQVSAGFQHTCGVTTSDRVFCWGQDQRGQIGDGPEVTPRNRPRIVRGALLFRELDAGAYHTCAVTRDNRPYCWGWNQVGQLGDGGGQSRFVPRAVAAGNLFFRRVSAGWLHTCGETPTNRAYCWGSNHGGNLGDGTTTHRPTPVAVAGGLQFVQLSTGADHTCARTADGAGYCWGENFRSQLGDGTTTRRTTPVRVQS